MNTYFSPSSDPLSGQKTGMFIGRFQPFHDGHKRCIEKILEQCDCCIVMVRDTKMTDNNPFDLEKRRAMIRAAFPDESRVIIAHINDPGADLTVFIGRDVGYDLIQLDTKTESISATDIRQKLYREREVEEIKREIHLEKQAANFKPVHGNC